MEASYHRVCVNGLDVCVVQAIIGTIGDVDSYQLPDSKGYTAFVRHVLGISDQERQERRQQILGTTLKDFRSAYYISKFDIMAAIIGIVDMILITLGILGT